MTTGTKYIIDFSTFPESDGEPMAETMDNQIQMVNLIFAFRRLFEVRGETRFAVGGNQFFYYNREDGRDHCSPDVYVALDVAPGLRQTWKTWVEGKFPEIIFEITSPSTQDVDLDDKPGLYARLGAREYYIYDPQQELSPALRGYELAGGRGVPMPLADDNTSIFSPLLGVELRIIGQYLRLINPATSHPFPMIEELQQIGEAEAAARRDAERRAVQEERADGARCRS